ncbi:hypothetical protein [Chryseobacterium sp.]|uniref:hypothetical protein n=1 Tax=Chryseobacterium sp. TaxID=1871047 RepID=UPI0028A21382|nr:hypothetical protein [Chryseobacterium sp.]
MKYLLFLFLTFLISSSPKPQVNYNLLVGSWSQKSFANTTPQEFLLSKKTVQPF